LLRVIDCVHIVDSMDELNLVYCQLEARSGVPFGIHLTDRRLIWERPVSFKMRPTETTVFEISDVSDATLRRRSPWPLRIWGVACGAVAVVMLISFASDQMRVFRLGFGILAAAMAFAAFSSARNRYELTFRAAGRMHRIRQPWTWFSGTRETMSSALREVADLLGDRSALAKAIETRKKSKADG
jgi:hypothetical protein